MINDFGRMKTGYVPYSELESYEYLRLDFVESLGEFQKGDRIEKHIAF